MATARRWLRVVGVTRGWLAVLMGMARSFLLLSCRRGYRQQASAANPCAKLAQGFNSARPPRVCHDCIGPVSGLARAGSMLSLRASPSHAAQLAQW